MGAPGQGPPVMVRISLGSGRVDFRISSTLIEFSKFSFHSDLLIPKVYDFPREAAKSDDVCSPSSSERMESSSYNS